MAVKPILPPTVKLGEERIRICIHSFNKECEIQELHEIYPNAKIKLVDGEMFSWYGSRLSKSVDYFKWLCTEI